MTTDPFFDTRALAKRYHPEPGTAAVVGMLSTPGVRPHLSRQSVVEMTAFLAKKVRIGALPTVGYQAALRQFHRDLTARRFVLTRVLVRHHDAAERLIRRLGPMQNLRTLDAIQLAVALDLHRLGRVGTFVCADLALCGFAAGEGLTVINPELP